MSDADIASSDMREVVDHFKIRRVLERYCRGVDRLDKELIDSVYWPEAVDNHGVYIGPGIDFADFLIASWSGKYTATMHIIAQSNIRVRGVAAAADTYLIAIHRTDDAGDISVETAYARYVDEFEKRADEWRILNRTVVMEHLQIERNIPSGSLRLADFVNSRQDREDLSYRFLGY